MLNNKDKNKGVFMRRRDIAVIAASVGGLKAICELLSAVDDDYEGSILAVLHTGSTSPRILDDLVQRHTSLVVKYGRHGESLARGHVYLAPPDQHLLISLFSTLLLSDGPKVHFTRPAADPLFETAAASFGARVVGVVLTGCDGDGTPGLRAIKRAGGLSVVQHPARAEQPHMPMSALNGDSPDYALSLSEIGQLLSRLAKQSMEESAS
jgi:two-component system, chemotaxis family, protein-glutamate methylesterase/glutaminase